MKPPVSGNQTVPVLTPRKAWVKRVVACGALVGATVKTFAVGALPASFTALSDDMLLVPGGLTAIGVAFIGAKAAVKVLGKIVSYIRG